MPPPRDHRHADGQQRQRAHQHHAQPPVLHQRDHHAAQQQNRRADAQTLDAAERLVDVVGVGGQPRNQARHGQLVHLLGRQPLDLCEQVVADRPRGVARHRGGAPVGDDVAQKRDDRADDHHRAPGEDGRPALRRRDVVDHVRENPRQREVHDRAGKLDREARQHRAPVGLQIADDPPHASHPTSRWMYACARPATRSIICKSVARSDSVKPSSRYSFHSWTVSRSCGSAASARSVG